MNKDTAVATTCHKNKQRCQRSVCPIRRMNAPSGFILLFFFQWITPLLLLVSCTKEEHHPTQWTTSLNSRRLDESATHRSKSKTNFFLHSANQAVWPHLFARGKKESIENRWKSSSLNQLSEFPTCLFPRIITRPVHQKLASVSTQFSTRISIFPPLNNKSRGYQLISKRVICF